MRIAYVIHRYGPKIRGGAEAHCRAFAQRVADRGVAVEIFTSCATDYRTWRNDLSPGTERDESVIVRRFPVAAERSPDFDEFYGVVLTDPQGLSIELQERWMHMQGPMVPDLCDALRDERERFDLIIFVTYLYWTTYFGLPLAGGRAVLHPTAHDEPPIQLSMFNETFSIPRGLVFLTEQERDFVRHRFGHAHAREIVTGIGVSAPVRSTPSRTALALPERYALCLGRIDESKGIEHLCAFFDSYRERRRTPVELVIAGDGPMRLPLSSGIRFVGSLDENEKWNALMGAEVLLQPSFYESFSMTLLEAWSVATPAVVNGLCDVTRAHCRKSEAGVWYRSYAEFEACLDRLLGDEDLRRELGQQGKTYVEALYRWDDIIDRYLDFLGQVQADL